MTQLLLTNEIADFLTGGVSIVLASRDASLAPSVARAKGCRVLQGAASRLRIFVSAAQAGALIEDVSGTGIVAVTFSLPNTHRTLQFKGRDAIVTPLLDEDRQTVREYLRNFGEVIRPLGFSDEFTRAFFASPSDEVAIEFTPSDAFQQTPGPAAGARLA